MTYFLVKKIPPQVHKRFKRRCVERNISMNAAIVELIKKAVRK